MEGCMQAMSFRPQWLVSGLAQALRPTGFTPLRRVRDALAARRAARELAQLDDRLLHDIGLDRSDVQRLLARPAPLADGRDEESLIG
jgi:uncharacterized protein YjiS (DUF1127 family)